MRSLRARMLFVVSVALTPALAFQAWTERDAHRMRERLVQDEALRLVRLVADQQLRIAEGAEQALFAIADAPSVQTRDSEGCRQTLLRLLQDAPRYNNGAVLGLDGHALCVAVGPNPDVSVSDRSYFRLALQTGGYVIGEYTTGRFSDLPTIHVARPYRDGTGQVAGVVSLALNVDWLNRQFDLLGLPPTVAVAVNDRAGITVARWPDPGRYVGKPGGAEFRRITEGNAAGVFEGVARDGRPRIVGYSPVGSPDLGLRVAIGLDRDAAFAEVTQAHRLGLVLIGAGAALCLALTALLGTAMIGRPVQSLLAASRRWSQGELAVRTGLAHDRSEFGRLAAGFDAMAQSLQAQDLALRARGTELRRLNDELESRVQREIAARESAQLRATQAERLQALGQLAAGIAHDFNNVMQSVAGAAGLIERHPDDPGAVRRMLRVIAEATARGAAVTRRLLAFGRHGDLRPEAVDAATLLQELRELLLHTLGRDIDLVLRVPPGLPPVLADRGHLETALVNLATNARDAMPGGGRLTFSAAVETIGGDQRPLDLPPGAYLAIIVADTGVGMDAATLRRAPEPFFTTKPAGQGTGLGLSMVRGFVEQSGGALDLASRPAQGTIVRLLLPQAADAARPPAGPPEGQGACAVGAAVLLVDDEPLLRSVLAEFLEEAGCAVRTAAGANEALAMLQASIAVDVLVTDLSMPGPDGRSLIRAAQALRPGLPAILLTGYAGEDCDAAAPDRRIELLRKPVSGHALLARISRLAANPATAG